MTIEMTLTAIRARLVIDARDYTDTGPRTATHGLVGDLRSEEFAVELPLEDQRPIGTRYLLSLSEIADG